MSTHIVDMYKLKFVIVDLLGERWKHCSAGDENTQKTLGCFLSCWQKTNRIEGLLKEIEELLDGEVTDVATGCESVLIDMYKDKTEFFDAFADADFSKPDFVMPTADFKTILEEWRNFLGTTIHKKLPMMHSVWM